MRGREDHGGLTGKVNRALLDLTEERSAKEKKMNKLILCLIAVMVSTILCGCAPPGMIYKNVYYRNSQEFFQVRKADIDQQVSAVKPLENWVAKSAEIVIPDLKICQIHVIKSFTSPKSSIDDCTESVFLNFKGVAEKIIKRNIFGTKKKTEDKHEYPFETEKYDYIIYLGSKKQANQPPHDAYDSAWWIKHKDGKYQMKLELANYETQKGVTQFLQQIEGFVSKTEAIVKGVKRFDTAKLKQGMTESELKNHYGSIKDTVFNDPFTSNTKYNIVLFEALPSLNSNKVNNDIAFTYWAMFHNNKAIAFGLGKEKEAEHSIYSALVNKKYASGKLKQSQAERMIFDNFRQLYGEPEPIVKEIVMFRIMLAEKMETGKISQSEADYLVAQKESEVAERLKEIQIREERLLQEDASRRAQIELQQRQLANQQQANEIAQRQANSQALLGVANFINQQTYQQQLIQSLNKPFYMNCWSNGHYTRCQQQ